MNQTEFRRTALDLMTQHRVASWTFCWDGAQRRAGQTRHNKKEIGFSWKIVAQMTDADQRNIILHEIAHAVCGFDAGHGAVWRSFFISIGGTGERTYNAAEMGIKMSYNFTLACGHCGTVIKHSLRRSNMAKRSHARCGAPRGTLVWLTYTGLAVSSKIHGHKVESATPKPRSQQVAKAAGQYMTPKAKPKACGRCFMVLTPSGNCPSCE